MASRESRFGEPFRFVKTPRRTSSRSVELPESAPKSASMTSHFNKKYGADMRCYRIAAINGECEYWLLADSDEEARRIVALNAREVGNAEDPAEYAAELDERKCPPHHLILRKSSYPVAIERR